MPNFQGFPLKKLMICFSHFSCCVMISNDFKMSQFFEKVWLLKRAQCTQAGTGETVKSNIPVLQVEEKISSRHEKITNGETKCQIFSFYIDLEREAAASVGEQRFVVHNEQTALQMPGQFNVEKIHQLPRRRKFVMAENKIPRSFRKVSILLYDCFRLFLYRTDLLN